MIIRAAMWFTNSSLTILSKGAVSLTGVTVQYSDDIGIVGIYIDNSPLTANITLTNVKSNNNGDTGIQLITKGQVTYNGGEIKNNGGTRAAGYKRHR